MNDRATILIKNLDKARVELQNIVKDMENIENWLPHTFKINGLNLKLPISVFKMMKRVSLAHTKNRIHNLNHHIVYLLDEAKKEMQ